MKKTLFLLVVLIVILFGCEKEIEVSKEVMEDVANVCEEQYDAAIKCAVTKEEEMIYLNVLVNGIDHEEKKELGEKFAKLLSERVSSTQGIKGPNDDYYGKLYDYYSLYIIVAGEDERFTYGNKAEKYEEIVWSKIE
ncbi:hypothetical protein [Oceanobacillus manasiensis]|uniref:hypothetical protein n=1 Tax=Oceanobacillus manasiensis TaxID=586413 RepID=UPI0005A6B309|nr:hypothetical protein [Oceanobacillus manasiensis]